MNYNFKCKRCGHYEIEEVVTDVTVSSVITNISLPEDYNEDDSFVEFDIEYGDCPENSGGEFSRYQCSKCGTVISEKDIVKMLKGNK